MRKILLALTILSAMHLRAQEIINIVLVGPNGITNSIEVAESFIVIKKFPGYYERIDYKKGGPRIRSRSFRDSSLTVLHGDFLQYRADGGLRATGHYKDNKKSDSWKTYDDEGKLVSFLKYENDSLIETVGVEKKDPVIAYEKKAEFPGGDNAWKKYINKSLERNRPAAKTAGGGMVVVTFVITENGQVEDAQIVKSLEFSLDEDFLTTIRQS
ncbi:MAG TPA: energy transducer TonB, partial [Flavitalea sp.]|nr:energy transducer TonB [Flavitalea sp.]